MNMICPLCCAEKGCTHQTKGFNMGGVWEDIIDFGYPSFPAYAFDEEAAKYRHQTFAQRRKIS
ncbi:MULTISPECIES: hypothetical protein [Aneurinibacillus]|uniref:Uncharacterized protein n=1 Tax=Aneurinibacillus danicus TaxID=267746 RepID=A0A511V783_9BACL|nr:MULTISPECIES: hypothetical protein [Aneurinibacillus]GEN34760.1 hypothetical protein ADA01nite_22200 [Aneurinibacillus danicus]